MLRRMALLITDISEEHIASIIKVKRIGELGTASAVTSTLFLRSVLRLLVSANVVPSSPIRVTLMVEALHSSETPVLTGITQLNIPEDGILPYEHVIIGFVSC
jgi:hypothetical protein